jgi:hypothetical protein
MEAYDCFKKALHSWFKPSRIPSAAVLDEQRAALNPLRFQQIFPKSAHLTEEEMATPASLTRMLRQRNRRLFQFKGVTYNPTFPDDAGAAERVENGGMLDGDEEFDENDEKELENAKLKLLD